MQRSAERRMTLPEVIHAVNAQQPITHYEWLYPSPLSVRKRRRQVKVSTAPHLDWDNMSDDMFAY